MFKLEIKIERLLKILIVFNSIVACFGSSLIHSSALLTAFGDFNHDRLTDIFLITDNGRSFELIFQNYHKVNFFKKSELKCSFKNGELIATIIPSDFTGNAMMDLILVSTPPSRYNVFNLRLLAGNLTHIDCNALDELPFAQVDSQPLLLDINGDMISDLLVEQNEEYYVWIGNHQTIGFVKQPFPFNIFGKHVSMKQPNSNSFIDLNNDGVADIVINDRQTIQYWLAGKDGYRTYWKKIPYPSLELPQIILDDLLIGQLTLADINNDQIIEHILPVCTLFSCSIYALNNFSSWEPILNEIKINNFYYHFVEFKERQLHLPVTLRVGDLTNDGYPDLVAIMKQIDGNDSAPSRVVLFENLPSNDNFLNRTFKPTVLEISSSVFDEDKEAPVLITYFDLLEDGKLDLIVNTAPIVSDRVVLDTQNFKIIRLSEREELDTNFLKVLVSTVLCTNNSCYGEDYYILEKYQVPYGTNKAGPQVCYELVDYKGHWIKSCSGQLSQSAHFALQMPYAFFNLGMYANYIERVSITVPSGNTSVIFQRIENQIVPDSQIVVIPNPLNEPRKWKIQFFLTPSEFINNTLYTFGAICLVLIIIIIILHRREVRQDEPERQMFKGFWVNK